MLWSFWNSERAQYFEDTTRERENLDRGSEEDERAINLLVDQDMRTHQKIRVKEYETSHTEKIIFEV